MKTGQPVGATFKIGRYTVTKRWERLMPELEARARALYLELKKEGVYVETMSVETMSLLEWFEGFLYDTHPDQEIALWEKIIADFRGRAADRGKTARARIWQEVRLDYGNVTVQQPYN